MWKLIVFLMLIASATCKRALVSVFADYGVGAGGTYLWKYPASLRVNGRKVRVYPAAIHSSLVSNYKYKVLRIRHNKQRAYVHIVDECAHGSCHTNHKKARNSGGTLLDIHESAMKRLGLRWTLQRATYTTVGRVGLKKIPRGLVSNDARKGYLPKKWK